MTELELITRNMYVYNHTVSATQSGFRHFGERVGGAIGGITPAGPTTPAAIIPEAAPEVKKRGAWNNDNYQNRKIWAKS
jgi:hypothetical protein